MSAPATNPFQVTAPTGTSAALFTGGSLVPRNGVQLKALSGNTGLVYWGWSGMTAADGFELSANQGFFIPIAMFQAAGVAVDAASVFVLGSAASQKLSVVVA